MERSRKERWTSSVSPQPAQSFLDQSSAGKSWISVDRLLVITEHCSATRQVCEGNAAVTDRQRRMARKLVNELNIETPAFDEMTFEETEAWISVHSTKWMAMP